MITGTEFDDALAPEPIIPTGLPGLDQLLNGGLLAGQFLLIASRDPRQAESLAARIAWNAAQRGLLTYAGGLRDTVDAMEFHGGTDAPPALRADRIVAKGGEEIADALLDIAPDRRPVGLAAFGVLDQFAARSGENLENRIDDVGRAIWRLGKRGGFPTVAAATLHKPGSHSSALECLGDFYYVAYSADIVLFVEPEPDRSEFGVQLVLAKRRNGPAGKVAAQYMPRTRGFVCPAGSD